VSERKIDNKGRLGESKLNKNGTKMTIIDYRKNNDITVEFSDGYKKVTTYGNFKVGNVNSIYDKTVFEIGCLGEVNADISYKYCKIYRKWNNMLQRCYVDNSHNRSHVYFDCKVCDEWLNFSNFKKWYKENYYSIEGQIMELDKDILKKGNRLYSPETCVFVPRQINTLFIKSNRIRGSLPLGVHWNSEARKYKAQCKTKNKVNMLGSFDCPIKAFEEYKKFKESYIKEVAEQFKSKIPEKLYNALIHYEVEITD